MDGHRVEAPAETHRIPLTGHLTITTHSDLGRPHLGAAANTRRTHFMHEREAIWNTSHWAPVGQR
jgi:hypothetical protein